MPTALWLLGCVFLHLGCSEAWIETAPGGDSRADTTLGKEETATPTETGGTTGPTTSSLDWTTGDGAVTDGSSTGGSACGQLRSASCLACNGGPGQPQRLFGLTWNFAGGGPGSSVPGTEELRCIVLETGDTEVIAMIPGMDWLLVGANAYDPDASILYALAEADADQIMRLFSLHTLTGELLAKPPVTPDISFAGGLHVRSDGTLVGLAWNPGEAREELHGLDPASGENSLVATIPAIHSILYAVNAYDQDADLIYMVGNSKDDPTTRLFAVDAESGALVGSPALTGPDGWSSIHVRADGHLIGVSSTGPDASKLLAIDPDTGGTKTIAELPILSTVVLDGNVYDPVDDALFVLNGAHQLSKINALSGEILVSSKLDKPSADSEYNWSGGLHVR